MSRKKKDLGQCQATVWSRNVFRHVRCSRRATTEEGGLAFCAQHSPTAEAERTQKTKDAFDARNTEQATRRRRRDALEALGAEALREHATPSYRAEQMAGAIAAFREADRAHQEAKARLRELGVNPW